jgi:hypothetical protein
LTLHSVKPFLFAYVAVVLTLRAFDVFDFHGGAPLLLAGFPDCGFRMIIGVLLGREAASVCTTNDFYCFFHWLFFFFALFFSSS